MKKSIVRALSVSAVSAASLFAMAGCGVKAANYVTGTPVKVGLICLHDANSTYDANFINALSEAVGNLGASKVTLTNDCVLTGINEDQACYDAAKDLVKKGCNLIFADSFGHQSYMLQAAKEWPSVQFCHATGTNTTVNTDVANYHNAFASIYEGRYLAGYAAGFKLAEMSNADWTNGFKVGYVGAFPYAEVKSGYTAWFLGLREAVRELGKDASKVTMDVQFTNSWYDVNAEASAATALINGGAILVSQHADSMGAPGVCEEKGVPNVTYNIETIKDCPDTYLAYSRINWAPYYEAVVNAMFAGKAIEGESKQNWTGTIATGSVEYNVNYKNLGTATGAALAIGLASQRVGLTAGTIKVFDTSKFTVGGEKVTSYLADVIDDGTYKGDTEAIVTDATTGISYFNESVYRSAPYFDLNIDGINLPA